MPGKRRKRMQRLEQRVTALEVLLDAPRDWAHMPPAYDIPLVDLPTLPDYVGWTGYEDEWRPSGYV